MLLKSTHKYATTQVNLLGAHEEETALIRENKKGISLDSLRQAAKRAKPRRIEWRGLPVLIENPQGSVRHWTDSNGQLRSTSMQYDYGEFTGTMGMDGDPLDVIVGPDEDAPSVYVAMIAHKSKFDTPDEEKVLVNFASQQDAKMAMMWMYDDPRFLYSMRELGIAQFLEEVKTRKAVKKSFFPLLLRKATATIRGHVRRVWQSPGKMAYVRTYGREFEQKPEQQLSLPLAELRAINQRGGFPLAVKKEAAQEQLGLFDQQKKQQEHHPDPMRHHGKPTKEGGTFYITKNPDHTYHLAIAQPNGGNTPVGHSLDREGVERLVELFAKKEQPPASAEERPAGASLSSLMGKLKQKMHIVEKPLEQKPERQHDTEDHGVLHVERVNHAPFVVNKGDRVKVWMSHGKFSHGTVAGISVANRQARVIHDGSVKNAGVWHAQDTLYPPDVEAPTVKKEERRAPLSKILRAMNKEPPGGWTANDKVLSSSVVEFPLTVKKQEPPPPTEESYFFQDRDTGKIGLRLSREAFGKLYPDHQSSIRSEFQWSPVRNVWISRNSRYTYRAENVARTLGLKEHASKGVLLRLVKNVGEQLALFSREVKNPGSRGGHFHRTKTGHIKYGERTGWQAFTQEAVEALEQRHGLSQTIQEHEKETREIAARRRARSDGFTAEEDSRLQDLREKTGALSIDLERLDGRIRELQRSGAIRFGKLSDSRDSTDTVKGFWLSLRKAA